jgi:hypothetical protein
VFCLDNVLNTYRSFSNELVVVKPIRCESKGAQQSDVLAKTFDSIEWHKHDHVIQLLTAFHYGNPSSDLHVLYGWADNSRLHDLIALSHKPNLTSAFVRRALEQLLGLFQALRTAPEGEP